MKDKIIKFLNRPYRFDYSVRSNFPLILFFGVFVFLFLQVFQPFGLNEFKHPFKIFIYAGYGLVTMTVILLNLILLPCIFPKVYTETNWKIKHEIMDVVIYTVTIGLAIGVYSGFVLQLPLSLDLLIHFQGYGFTIGVLPLSFFIIVRQILILKENLRWALQLNQSIDASRNSHSVSDNRVEFVSDNEKMRLEIPVSSLLYIEAADNYTEIVWQENGGIKRQLLRSTLKRLAEYMEDYPSVVQCHRRFLINVDNVKKIVGTTPTCYAVMPEREIPIARRRYRDIQLYLMNH